VALVVLLVVVAVRIIKKTQHQKAKLVG